MEKQRGFEPLKEGNASKEERLINARDAVHSDSTLEEYEEWLGIDTNEFVGKKVLDIGGMPNGQFAKKARTKGIDVVTFNPSTAEIAKERKVKGKNTVAGLVQQIPFKDKSFDFEISYGAVPSHLTQYEGEYEATFEEIFRTLKVEGKAYLCPVYEPVAKSDFFKNLMEKISKKGADIIVEHVGFQIDEADNNKKVKVYKLTLKRTR